MYNLDVIKTKAFKQNKIVIHFKRPTGKKDKTYTSLLSRMLFECNEVYRTARDVEVETENLYWLGLSMENLTSGEVSVCEISFEFLNEKYTEKGMNKKSIDFLMTMLFNPHVVNGKFDAKVFNRCKKELHERVKSLKDNPNSYADIRFRELLDPNGILGYRNIDEEILDSITRESLYEYYLDRINNDEVNVYIAGNVDDNLVNYFKEQFPIKNKRKQNLNHRHLLTHIKEPLLVTEDYDSEQAKLLIGLTVPNITFFEERYVMNLLNFILGVSSHSKLFVQVREKNSLCYAINSCFHVVNDLMVIKAGIDYDKYDKTKALIMKQIDEMAKGHFSKNDMKMAVKFYENGLITLQESLSALINFQASKNYIQNDNIETKLENIHKVTKEDIMQLASKLTLKKIYLLGRDNNA